MCESSECSMYQIWVDFVREACTKVQKTNFKFSLSPSAPHTTINRMVKTYLMQRAVYINLDSIKKWFKENANDSNPWLRFNAAGDDILYVAVAGIKLTEV